MDGRCCEGRINSFALVGYLPEPLGSFVNGLRRELDPSCLASAHVTILPPRPLACSPDAAWAELRNALQGEPPFPVELREVEVFPGSDVIYISIGTGFSELERLHGALNKGSLQFNEPWCYHPHVTLAQGGGSVGAGLELAAKRWSHFKAPRHFRLDRLTFVQNTLEKGWLDLACSDLRAGVPA